MLQLITPRTQDLIVKINHVRVKSRYFLRLFLDSFTTFIAYMMFAAIVLYIFITEIGVRNKEFSFTDQTYG